jgi:ferritin-like metal-binding protein YciE
MPTSTLEELYVEQLRDLYNAENQLVKALPKMAKSARSEELREGFETHLEQTREHVSRLEQIFEALGESPKGRKCAGMEGLVKEGEEIIKEESASAALDAGLIAAAQRVEHYEIAGYGSVRAFAELLGEDEAVRLLQETLDEEKQADEKLTELSQDINAQALNSSEESETGIDTQEDQQQAAPPQRAKRSSKSKSARA